MEAARRSGASGAELLPASVEQNVRLVTTQVPERSGGITAEIQRREIAVVGAVYDLQDGRVTRI